MGNSTDVVFLFTDGSYRYQDAVYVAPVIFETPGVAVATTEPSVKKEKHDVILIAYTEIKIYSPSYVGIPNVRRRSIGYPRHPDLRVLTMSISSAVGSAAPPTSCS